MEGSTWKEIRRLDKDAVKSFWRGVPKTPGGQAHFNISDLVYRKIF